MTPALVLLLLAPNLASSEDWSQFRGPLGTGVVPGGFDRTSWSQDDVAWTATLPGPGWSQPVVLGQRVYVTAAVGPDVEAPMGFAQGVADPRTMKPGSVPDIEITWQVVALDLATGKQRWVATAGKGKPTQPIHPSNSWASETPCVDANGVYAFFGMAGIVAGFDHDGKTLWTVDVGVRPTAQGYGTSSSPALHDGLVYVQCFDQGAAFLVALDTRTGKEAWRATRPVSGTAWGSPIVWHNAERVEVVASSGALTAAYDPRTGKELWRVGAIQSPNSCSFGADAERIYLGQKSPMANPPLYALGAGGSGDLTPAEGERDIGNQAWVQSSASPGIPSPVAADGLLFLVVESILTCRDAASGEQLYKERLQGLGTVIASPIVVGEHLIVLDEEGRALVLRVGPDFEIVGQGRVDDVFWSTPSVAGDALLLRGPTTLYCIRN
jgi:outer membrane protein assembly factor BamB